MKYRKSISIFLLVAFVQLTTSCTTTRQHTPDRLKPGEKNYRVVRILKTSGETVDFDKNYPAYLGANEIRWGGLAKVPANGTKITQAGNLYIVETKDGKTYEAITCVRSGEDYVLSLRSSQSVPLSEVSMVWVRESNNLGTALVVLGVIAAALGIVTLIIALTKESCPFLYASDGTELNLEGELYSGAIFKGMERRDFLKLHFLAAGLEGYRLKIANEAKETQYTDELTLLAVDHPKEIAVYAGSDGLIHTVGSPLAALSAEDFDGKDFTTTVSAVDGKMWSSNPVGKDPENPAHWWSGLTLRFPKLPAAEKAKLVVRIGNTYWADYAFGQLLGMMGGMMQPWYQTTGEDPAIREKAERFLSNQGVGLKVQIQGREGWRDAGFFYPTGPFGIQDDILELPLGGTPDDNLTVRLQGGTFFWMIDYAAVDYSPDRSVEAQALSPYEAVDNNGKDVTQSLIRTDGDYFVMPEPGDYATVRYLAPPLRPGLERSFLLRSAGYYTVRPREDGPPDVQKLLAIQQNPDLFLKFSLQEIQKQIMAAANPKGGPAKIAALAER